MIAPSRFEAVARAAVAVLICPLLLARPPVAAGAPATPLMTVYQFDGPRAVPYYEVGRFVRDGPASPAGTLVQGTSVIPCLVLRGGQPVTDGQGTPYVGFEVVIDANEATPVSTARFKEVYGQRQAMTAGNHHCPAETAHVIDVRRLHPLGKPPSFDPPRPEAPASAPRGAHGELDEIVRAFHASRHCETANGRLVGRRDALSRGWSAFAADGPARWGRESLARARHLDYGMRTALYEGHLDRGCGAYGACERNVIALSIRNRGIERCLGGQGCSEPGDFAGVASAVSQYNIWDEVLTQTTGLTSCFLRPDLAGHAHYARLQAMYEQTVGDVERILYGNASDFEELFRGTSQEELTRLRHYYHPPAMGKCFPHHERLEYITGAVARRGDDFALIAGTRIEVGDRRDGGYLFREAVVKDEGGRDVVDLRDRYPGFVIDGRKVELRAPSRCAPYGTPPGCRFDRIDRYRKTPSWLASGKPQPLTCRVRARGEDCRGEAVLETAKVGGKCDTEMQPVGGVP